jgi:hypothetical protein
MDMGPSEISVGLHEVTLDNSQSVAMKSVNSVRYRGPSAECKVHKLTIGRIS